MAASHPIDLMGVAWRLGATLLLVVLNGFFVAAEFALVTVRRARVIELAEEGRFTARMTKHVLDHLDHYLSACQLGITLASLVLGALGEPAIATLLTSLFELMNLTVDASSPWLRGTSLVLAFTSITILHMTLGEQAPKMWALQHAQPAALGVSLPLRAFTLLFWPFITFVNAVSNSMLRAVGIDPKVAHETVPTRGELQRALDLSMEAGHIPEQGRALVDNVLRAIDMQVRHIVVPRINVAILSLKASADANLSLMRKSGHSRYPLCENELDSIVGFVHTRDIFARGATSMTNAELRALTRPALLVPDTWPLGELIAKLQTSRSHVAVVIDEFGAAVGLAFLEDALEEIVGPIADEFDDALDPFVELESGDFEVNGSMPLPAAVDRFGLAVTDASGSTLGGYVTSVLGRLPKKGDEVRIGNYDVRVLSLVRGRAVNRLRLTRRQPTPKPEPPAAAEA
ncbi:MAG TPA: hemolysin family protein [Polyangiaceae bacterium]|nr:hemolysin family protein [Polyangiaceae bacterium]